MERVTWKPYMLPRIKQITKENLLYDRELKLGLCNNLEVWEGEVKERS